MLRSSSALWNGSIVGTPLSSFLNTLYYRRDALALAGVEAPPSTWQELVQVARLLNGTDWDKGEWIKGNGSPGGQPALRKASRLP